MTLEEKLSLKNNVQITRDELNRIIKEFYPNYQEASIRWVIYNLVKKGVVSKLNTKSYRVGKFNRYHPNSVSEEKGRVLAYIKQTFPNIKIVVYESILLNEWINHQITRNVVFVEVEKYFVLDVFRELYNFLPSKVFLNLDKDDLNTYSKELIVVSSLKTQAPVNYKTSEIKIEKLIVDIYTKDLISEFINDDEKEDVLETIFKTYIVDLKTIYAYAKRRNNMVIMKKVLFRFENGGLYDY